MKQERFDEMIGTIAKVFEDYGVDSWSLESEEYSGQQLIYVGLYEDDKGDYLKEDN